MADREKLKRKRFTPAEFAAHTGLDEEYIRQCCRAASKPLIDRSGPKLPAGWRCIKEKNKWFIVQSFNAIFGARMADLDEARNAEPGEESIDQLLPKWAQEDGDEDDHGAPEWYDWLEPEIDELADNLVRKWKLQMYFEAHLARSIYSPLCQWSKLVEAASDEHAEEDCDSATPGPFKLKKGRRLFELLAYCYEFSAFAAQETTISLTFKTDGHWTADVVSPLEPNVVDAVVFDKEYFRIGLIRAWAREVSGGRSYLLRREHRGVTKAYCLDCATEMPERLSLPSPSGRTRRRIDAKFCDDDCAERHSYFIQTLREKTAAEQAIAVSQKLRKIGFSDNTRKSPET